MMENGQDELEFAVDKGVPIPKPGGGRKSNYPWGKMSVGDSFFVPSSTKDKYMVSSSSAYRAKYGELYTCRSVEGGTRVWRIR